MVSTFDRVLFALISGLDAVLVRSARTGVQHL